MYCKNCGTENPNESSFCQKCGTPMVQTKKETPKANLLFIVIPIIAICILIGSTISKSTRPNQPNTPSRVNTPTVEELKSAVIEKYIDTETIKEFTIASETATDENYSSVVKVVYEEGMLGYEKFYCLTYSKNEEWELTGIEPYNKENWRKFPIAGPVPEKYLDDCKNMIFECEEEIYSYDTYELIESKTTVDLENGKATLVYAVTKNTESELIESEIEFFFEVDEETAHWELDSYNISK